MSSIVSHVKIINLDSCLNMAAINFFLDKGYSPKTKTIVFSGLGTASVWTPLTSTRVTVTDLSISANNAGTIAFYWGNLAGDKVAEFIFAGSSNISPAIGCWEGTAYDRSLFAKLGGASGTDGVRVNLTGFELD